MGSREEVLTLAEKLNEIGKKCAREGLALGYHNHDNEFKKDGGEYLLDILYTNTDPAYLKVQLDVCWALVGGVDPVEYLKKYGKRSLTCHMKEVKTVSPYEGDVIGRGIVDFKGIVKTLGPAVEYIVEQEDIATDCWEGLAQSVKYLKTL
jgi:sugar phosphate isomerase/epimerase